MATVYRQMPGMARIVAHPEHNSASDQPHRLALGRDGVILGVTLGPSNRSVHMSTGKYDRSYCGRPFADFDPPGSGVGWEDLISSRSLEFIFDRTA